MNIKNCIISILFLLCLIPISIFLSNLTGYNTVKAQSIISSSYDNTIFVAFLKARGNNKPHDADILKALLLVQGNSSAKIKLAKICKRFIKDEGLKDK